ncbi:hypothetical protein CKCBHOJB_02617 [Thauera sp. GDN1]|nr:hypothetical protein CKCBHOJB_02617 [Thauera sp. GDN1]
MSFLVTTLLRPAAGGFFLAIPKTPETFSLDGRE